MQMAVLEVQQLQDKCPSNRGTLPVGETDVRTTWISRLMMRMRVRKMTGRDPIVRRIRIAVLRIDRRQSRTASLIE
jgi:hypothetical protein